MTNTQRLRKEIQAEWCPDLCGIEEVKEVCLILLEALDKYGDENSWAVEDSVELGDAEWQVVFTPNGEGYEPARQAIAKAVEVIDGNC